MTIPYVFIFDIDGTMIGDIRPQVVVYDILNEIKHLTKGTKKLYESSDFEYKLKNGIVRPYLINFINDIKKQYHYVEFFIYTASQNQWALYLIKAIEKALDIQFNRPIFTRNDCMYINGEYRKSLARIKGRIFKTLKRKYSDYQPSLMKDHIVMIDNSKVFQPNDENIIYCPTYTFKYPENLPAIISREIYEKYYKIINKYTSHIPLTSNYLKFQKYYYQNYINDLIKMKTTDDRFWILLKDILINKNIVSFDSRTIKYINMKIQDT